MTLVARFSIGRDLLLEAWLIDQLQAQTDVTPEEYCHALQELAPARPADTGLNCPPSIPAVPTRVLAGRRRRVGQPQGHSEALAQSVAENRRARPPVVTF